MKRIALVGCGNIGSRHLQAIAKLPFTCSVQIIEPSETAQRIAKSRLAEVPHFTNKIDFHWNVSLRDLKSESDLTIVAT
ncbi:MAG: Gfo/Idh/MocA family oxidoreductase, partial [Nitrososphaera sp.]